MEKGKAYLYAFLAVALWATVASAFKISLRHGDAYNLLFLSSIFSTFIFFIILTLQNKIGKIKCSTRGNLTGFALESKGIVFGLGSAVIWATFWIYNLKDKRDEVTKLFLNFSFGLLFIIIFMLSQRS